jgi:hypothetical protein
MREIFLLSGIERVACPGSSRTKKRGKLMHTHYSKTKKRLESVLTFKAFGTIVSK